MMLPAQGGDGAAMFYLTSLPLSCAWQAPKTATVGPRVLMDIRAEATSLAHAPLAHLTSLTKHKVKNKITKNFKIVMAEHEMPGVGPSEHRALCTRAGRAPGAGPGRGLF